MRYIKQYGLERSGTNLIRSLLEINYDVRVLSNLFGAKHEIFDITPEKIKTYDFKIDSNVITDLSEESVEEARSSFEDGSMEYMIIFKDIYAWAFSYKRYLCGISETKTIEEIVDRYNEVYMNWINMLIKRKSAICIDYFDLLGDNGQRVCYEIGKQWNLNPITDEFTPILNRMYSGPDNAGSKNISNDTFKKIPFYTNKTYMMYLSQREQDYISNNADYGVISYLNHVKI